MTKVGRALFGAKNALNRRVFAFRMYPIVFTVWIAGMTIFCGFKAGFAVSTRFRLVASCADGIDRRISIVSLGKRYKAGDVVPSHNGAWQSENCLRIVR